MKHLSYITLYCIVAISILSSCNQHQAPDLNLYDISISRIQSSGMWVDITTDNNHSNYLYGVTTIKEYNQYKNEADFIAADYEMQILIYETVKEILSEYYDEEYIQGLGFADIMADKGDATEHISGLQPETDYYFYIYLLDDKGNPLTSLKKEQFRTGIKPVSDIRFDAKVTGSVVEIIPSNQDTYYWDYELKTVITDNYLGSPYLWFTALIEDYYEYDFIDARLSKENDSEDIGIYYNLQEGDTLQVACAGYNKEISSECTFFEIVYHTEEGKQTEIYPIEDTAFAENTPDKLRLAQKLLKRSLY